VKKSAGSAKPRARAATARRAPPAKQATPRPRKRRLPEEARTLILAACQRLLVQRGPDAVGLKDVAKEAGVSHALVTHYFGSIESLISGALEAYAETQRRAIMEKITLQPDMGPREWMEHFFSWGSRPEAARMLAWSFLKGLTSKEDFFSRRTRGAKRIVDAVIDRSARTPDAPKLERDDLEFMVLLVLAATHGYALGRVGYWPSLGVDAPGPREDSFFFDRLAELVQLFALSRAKPAP